MKIKKDGTVLNVSKGAFTALFAPMGYVDFYEDAETVANKPVKHQEQLASEDIPFGNILNNEPLYDNDEPEDDDYEVVLEDMTVSELVEYAAEQDIDIEGLRKKQEIINKIKKARA